MMQLDKNKLSRNKVITPITEKHNLCPYCYAKLPILQSIKKELYGRVRCPACGKMIKKDKFRVY